MPVSSKMEETVRHAWDLLGEGKFDELASLYSDDMIMVIPGQNDVISGRSAFRTALDAIGDALPPGFAISDMRYCVGDGEITNIVEWKSDKLPAGRPGGTLVSDRPAPPTERDRWPTSSSPTRTATCCSK